VKILHVIRGLANSSGTTHIVGPLAEAQARLGHEVSIFFVEKHGEAAVVPDAQLVESRSFPMTITSRHYGWSRQFHAALRKHIARFDVVHIHAIWNFPTWCAMREAHRVGVPYLVAPQGSLEDWALGRHRHSKRLYGRIFEKPWFDRADRMQALTKTEAEQCRRFGIQSPAAILPNGVDLERIDSYRQTIDLHSEFDLPPDDTVLLFLGRISPKKGLDLLASAFGRLVEQRRDVTLLIAGHDAETGYRDEVVRLLRASGGDCKTHFVGELTGARKFAALRDADLFVLSSYSEGLPIAVLEAMGVGLPVVITPGCHLPEVAEQGAGWIVQPSAESLYNGLNEALDDCEELAERGRIARQLVESQFTWKRIAERSAAIYREVLGLSREGQNAIPEAAASVL
jgi:glycosyltransferase involved in cell wall biosynthesis